MRPYLYFLLLFCSCKTLENQDKKITIINIGKHDRISLGQQLRIVNSFKPTVVGIDFIVRKDSADKDSILRYEFLKINKGVYIMHLSDYDKDLKYWTTQIRQHDKFQFHHSAGFSNLITKKGKIMKSFSLHEKVKDSTINSFSFQVAKEAGKINSKYLTNKDVYQLDFVKDKPYDIISADDLVNNKFDSTLITNRIILFGYVGPELDDIFELEDSNKKIYGVEVHAYIINQLLKK